MDIVAKLLVVVANIVGLATAERMVFATPCFPLDSGTMNMIMQMRVGFINHHGPKQSWQEKLKRKFLLLLECNQVRLMNSIELGRQRHFLYSATSKPSCGPQNDRNYFLTQNFV